MLKWGLFKLLLTSSCTRGWGVLFSSSGTWRSCFISVVCKEGLKINIHIICLWVAEVRKMESASRLRLFLGLFLSTRRVVICKLPLLLPLKRNLEEKKKSYLRGWDADLVCIFMSSSLLEEHWDDTGFKYTLHVYIIHKLHIKTKKMEQNVMIASQMVCTIYCFWKKLAFSMHTMCIFSMHPLPRLSTKFA